MIIIATDKFKGTLSATEACSAIACGLRDAGISDSIRQCPMADGGDGTADVLAALLPHGHSVVESHLHIGPDCFLGVEPMCRSSLAFGKALAEALRSNSHVYATIGGTACCDGGAGMLQALGMKAYRPDGSEITVPLSPRLLPEIAATDLSCLPDSKRITVLSDVYASLTPDGQHTLSALDFAGQKGFASYDMHGLTEALIHWQNIVAGGRRSEIDGAGGGIGFALAAVLGSRAIAGAAFVADLYDMPFAGAGLVISGEGRIDTQTGAGKAVSEIAARAAACGTPFLAIGGSVHGRHPYPTLPVDAHGTPPPATTAEAYARLRRATAAYFTHHSLTSLP